MTNDDDTIEIQQNFEFDDDDPGDDEQGEEEEDEEESKYESVDDGRASCPFEA